MEELKSKLMEQLGLDEGGSNQAVQLVLGFVKDKLPESMQGMVDSIMNGESPEGGGGAMGGIMDTAKNIFGGDK